MSGASFGSWLNLGIAHIFTGYDHLVFLLGLLAGCTRWKDLFLLLTCFTAGHSITLALASFDLVRLSPRIGEPLIALTIVLVGLENLRKREPEREPRGRYPVTVIFGLIHGFGFATALRDLGIGPAGVNLAAPLLGFNLGVEVGQICFVAVFLPLFWWLRSEPRNAKRTIPALSVLVASLGCYWLVMALIAPGP
jgi:hydrogenase/urease accessory protein HupE